MKIAETFTVQAPVERVWRFITDPERVAPCVPGCQSHEVLGPRQYRARIRVAVGPIKTVFNVTVELTDERSPTFLASTTRGEEGSRASTLTAHSELRLAPSGEGMTEVSYSSEISLVGRLGKFGLGMMKKKARKLGEEFAETFRALVEADGAADLAGSAAATSEAQHEVSPAGHG